MGKNIVPRKAMTTTKRNQCWTPAWDGVQHWFLLVVVIAFLGTIFFSLYYLCLAEPLNKLQVNWLMGEFWFTSATTFFYFTAFVAMLAILLTVGGQHRHEGSEVEESGGGSKPKLPHQPIDL